MNSLSMVDPEHFLGSVQWRQRFDMDEQIQVQLARLESDVQHIDREVADIKVDLRRTNDKLDATNQRVDVLRDKVEQGFRDVNARIDGVQEKLTEKIGGVEQKLTEKIEGVEQKLTEKIEGVREDLTQKIEGVRVDLTQKNSSLREDLTQKIDAVRQDIAAAKVWAMGLYIALAASLLFVMAKGFHWL
jgi:chromosome segregation ATPase